MLTGTPVGLGVFFEGNKLLELGSFAGAVTWRGICGNGGLGGEIWAWGLSCGDSWKEGTPIGLGVFWGRGLGLERGHLWVWRSYLD